jgi:hypothetical protein
MSNVKAINLTWQGEMDLIQEDEYLLQLFGRMMTNPHLNLRADVYPADNGHITVKISGEEAVSWKYLEKMVNALDKIGRVAGRVQDLEGGDLMILDGRFEVYHSNELWFDWVKGPETAPSWPDDYQLVALVSGESVDHVFQLTNTIDRYWPENKGVKALGKHLRSTSIGDVVVDRTNDKVYRCEAIGWKELDVRVDIKLANFAIAEDE